MYEETEAQRGGGRTELRAQVALLVRVQRQGGQVWRPRSGESRLEYCPLACPAGQLVSWGYSVTC